MTDQKRDVIPASRYDLETYWGRVCQAAEVSNPLTLFNSNETIRRAQRIMAECSAGERPLDEDVWRAKRLVDSSVHPDTGKIVMLPFRMSSYVLSNLVVTVGMLTPNLTTAGTLFWQIANQSLNVAVNYANANKSNPLSNSQLATNYVLAVTGSCSVAVGLNSLLPRIKSLSANTKALLSRLVPFAAVVSAGMLNVYLMRRQEIEHGITVFDEKTNEPLGKSRIAAKKAVWETAVCRAVTAMPVMVVPPLILYRLQQGVLKNKSMRAVTAVNLGLIATVSFAILPFTLAIFPSKTHMSGSSLEKEFATKRVWFNRGL